MESARRPQSPLSDEARLLRAARSLDFNRRRIAESERRQTQALGVLLAGLAQLGQTELTVGTYHLQMTGDDLVVQRLSAPDGEQLPLPTFPALPSRGTVFEGSGPPVPPTRYESVPPAPLGTPALYEQIAPYHSPHPDRPRQLRFLAPDDSRLLVHLEALMERARLLLPDPYRPPEPGSLRITSPSDVALLLQERMSALPQEQLRILTLSTAHDLLAEHMVYQGKLSSAEVRPADIFRRACLDNAAALIVVHNHPSGDPTPSGADVQVTRTLTEVGRELQIPVLDHIVVALRGYVSLRERGLL